MSATARGIVLGVPVVTVGAVLPLVVLVTADDPGAGIDLLLVGVVMFATGVAWALVGQLLRPDRLRTGTCPYTGEPAVYARYSFALASGWYVFALGLTMGFWGLALCALLPLLAGELNLSLFLLVPASAFLALAPWQVVHLLTGRIRRGGIWLTPTGLVHRSWDSGLAYRWDDLASVTFRYRGTLRIEARPDAPQWLQFPERTWSEVPGPEEVGGAVLGRRACDQIVALAEQCLRDPAARAAVGSQIA